ncbi:hypothetical protein KSF_086340 [Reticulibacter mediterranei]|uniref:Uncharacterized protein n=1 Tax=Reticulibacter mediterranei TaxID=2778369 RepID=A0A8J3J0G6_9CHLR|nr:phosphoribosyltransferase family protein [Reticulibacter mediterranei]GHO98586.1 hypothetical protein KSF_086340 [Reticulibacter mediterranei]
MPEIPTHELALYHLNEAGLPVKSTCPFPFVAADYSRYKYGATAVADRFASALGDAFQHAFPHLIFAPSLLIASSPYKYVPTAAHALACLFLRHVNLERDRRHLPPACLIKIARYHLSAGDYGTLPIEQRRLLMRSNTLSLDPAALEGAHLVMIDDIKVSGAHQERLREATETQPLASRTFLHIASFFIHPSAVLDPTIEDRLNHAFVKTLDDLMGIIQASDFVWNVRLCKFLLSARNRAELPAFLERLPDRFLLDLCERSCGDSYDLMATYRESHLLVQAALQQRQVQVPGNSAPRGGDRVPGKKSSTA